MSENNARILRFHLPDKVFHSLNAILWFALVITGAIVYLCDLEPATGEALMLWHVGLGVAFSFCLFGYIFFAPDRFAPASSGTATRCAGSSTSAATPVASSTSPWAPWKFRLRVATTAVRRPPTCSLRRRFTC